MGKLLAVLSVIAGIVLVVTTIIHAHFGIESQPVFVIDLYSYALVIGAFIWVVSLICLAFGFKQSK